MIKTIVCGRTKLSAKGKTITGGFVLFVSRTIDITNNQYLSGELSQNQTFFFDAGLIPSYIVVRPNGISFLAGVPSRLKPDEYLVGVDSFMTGE